MVYCIVIKLQRRLPHGLQHRNLMVGESPEILIKALAEFIFPGASFCLGHTRWLDGSSTKTGRLSCRLKNVEQNLESL